MSAVLEQLKNHNHHLPEHLSREKARQGGIVASLMGLLAERANPVSEIANLLASSEMDKLIEGGEVTIAMIKPRLDLHMNTAEAKVNFASDPELTSFLTDQMRQGGLDPILSVSMQMSPAMLDEFYGRRQPDGGKSPKENMQSRAGEEPGTTLWDEFCALMDSGPVTFVLLHAPSGNAVDTWRKVMGTKFDVEWLKQYEPDSLRAKFALRNKNNLLHGSDGTNSVFIERNFIVKYLR